LKSIGVWQLPHPWMTLFLPEDQTTAYVGDLVAGLTTADTGGGPILFYPFNTAKMRRPLFRVPRGAEAFHLSILRTAPPVPSVIAAMLGHNRSLYDRAVAVGGHRYIIGAIPGFTQHDWQQHFLPRWGLLVSSKERFDPDNILTPGQGMFPR
jgi:hypothetical protein